MSNFCATAYMLSAHMLSQFRLSVCPSVRPSVRLSVTRVDRSKRIEAQKTLVQRYYSAWTTAIRCYEVCPTVSWKSPVSAECRNKTLITGERRRDHIAPPGASPGQKNVGWTHMASAGVWGRSPQRDPGQSPWSENQGAQSCGNQTLATTTLNPA